MYKYITYMCIYIYIYIEHKYRNDNTSVLYRVTI